MASNLGKKINIDDCFDEIQKTIKDFDKINIKENGLKTTAKPAIHELLDQSRDTHTVKQKKKKPLESSNLNEDTSGIFLPKSTCPDMQSQVFKNKPLVTNSTYVRPDMQQSTSSNQEELNAGDKPPPRRDDSIRRIYDIRAYKNRGECGRYFQQTEKLKVDRGISVVLDKESK